jgi:hypothetical protein
LNLALDWLEQVMKAEYQPLQGILGRWCGVVGHGGVLVIRRSEARDATDPLVMAHILIK